MKRLINLAWLAALFLFAQAALAQPHPDDRYDRRAFSQAELDQMLAPIALYPDSLLSQILMAATYPRDLAEAASWSRVNAGVRGDAAVRAVEGRDWDPSVVSLVAFPEVLAMLDERREWTERLAEAYMGQHEEVLDTIQQLRRRADEAGSLRSSEEIVVHREGGHYVIEPPSPEVVYVPYYDPRYVYGAWWWPSYQPIWWRPWPGYWYRPGYRGYGWGPRVIVGRHFFFGDFDWRHRHVRWSSDRPWYWRGDDWRSGHRWTRDDRRGPHRWSEADRQRWRDSDRNRWRDGDRNRWRDGDRDRWRDGDRDRRGDGDRDRRRDADRDRRRGDAPRVDGAQPSNPTMRAPSAGFFPPEQRVAPQPAQATQPAPRYPSVAPGTPTYRGEVERRRAPAARGPEPQVQPQPQPRSVDVQRERAVPSNPVARQPVEAPVRVETPKPEAPARSERSGRPERSSETGSNGMGRGGGGDRR